MLHCINIASDISTADIFIAVKSISSIYIKYVDICFPRQKVTIIMINMENWPTIRVNVMSDIYLDPHNIRLDISDNVPESDIIQDLFNNEKALDLVKNIVELGFLTYETPVVLKRGKKLVVIEGNRRIAALKAIQNPYLVPAYQPKIVKIVQNISDKDRDSLRFITVREAPSQDEADRLIAALHTGNTRRPWSPTRQAAFFQAQLDSGKTPKELIENYPTIDVRSFITRSYILDIFRNVNYDDATLSDYTRKGKFPISTLARLYDNNEFLNIAGINVHNDTGVAELVSDPTTFKVIATKVVQDMKDHIIDTRKLNKRTGKNYINYMNDIKKLLTDGNINKNKKQNTFTADTNENLIEAKQENQQIKSKIKKQFNNRNNRFLDTNGLLVPSDFPNSISSILQEVSELDINKFPNATLDILRTLLEKTIKAYIDVSGGGIENVNKKRNNGYIYLNDCLIWLENHFKDNGKKALIQPITKIRTERFELHGFVGTQTHLNSVNHNHLICVSAQDVRSSWLTIQVVLKAILDHE